MEKKTLRNIIDAASGRSSADLCIRNCRIVDVYNRELVDGDVYIKDGYIAGFGDADFPEAKETLDAGGRILAPGFIDSHLHIESSHLSPAEYARLVLPCGTTTVIADPHEICNVCGIAGLDYMLKASENLPLSVFLQFPSCVPATPFENSGAVLKANEISTRIENERVLGLGELMDFVGVANADNDILDKIMVARNAGKIIDGHSPGIYGSVLDAYCASGVKNDHECATADELRDRIRRGVYVLLRQGTVCHDLLNLLKGVDEKNAGWCLFCTDDCQAKTMIEIGHIDNNVRMSIEAGLDPILAICMATINAATCFHLTDRGAVAPGMRADLVLLSGLDKNMKVEKVFCGGKLVAQDRKFLGKVTHAPLTGVKGKMNVSDCSAKRFALSLKSDKVRTIKIIPGSVVTEAAEALVDLDEKGCWKRNSDDIVKVAVVERHNGTGNIGLGLIQGFGLRGGALATSVAHDSHNIIVAGDCDSDMEMAVKELVRLGGGMTVVSKGKVICSLEHEIAGLMTDRPGEEVAHDLAEIQNTARECLKINEDVDPFMTLCFMALPVIPVLKITDLGLFDVTKFSFVSVEV